MNKFSVTLLIFAWSIPFLFFFGIISLFCDNKFSGAWILSPIEYPLSHSIFVFVALSCAAILNWALGNIKNYNKLLFILLGIFGGLIINISSIVFGLAKLGHSIITIFSLVFLIFYPIIKLEWSQIKLILMGLLFICLARLFLLLNQKVDNKKLSFYLAVLIVSSPCLPMVIPPIVGSLIGNKLSSANRESFSPRKKFLLAIIKLIIITFCFIWIAKSYHTPVLIISSGLRHIWGLTVRLVGVAKVEIPETLLTT